MSVQNYKFIVVTGGNRGIGYEVCKRLLTDHRNVIMTTRDLNVGQSAAEKLMSQTKSKGKCEVLQLDVQNSQSIQNFSHQIEKQFDQEIHTVVNNAGILESGWSKYLFYKTKKINFEGPVELIKQILPYIQQSGRIINVSSGGGELQMQSEFYREAISQAKTIEDLQKIQFKENDAQQFSNFSPIYCVSKAMLNRYTQILAEDMYVNSKCISANSVCPGWCRTGMGGESATRSAEEGADSVMWLVNHPEPSVTGGFYRDGRPIDW